MFKHHEHFKDSHVLVAVQQEMEQAVEAEKLTKRQARTPEVAVQSSLSAINSRKAALAKAQERISELEEAAKKANEAVEEAKQKAEKLQGEIVSYRMSLTGPGSSSQACRPGHTPAERARDFPGRFREIRSPASLCPDRNRFRRTGQSAGGGNAHSDGNRCAR